MKNDFLTIPDAPNYEINSQLFVRNKRTGRILKVSTRGYKNSIFYNICHNGSASSKVAVTLRETAEEKTLKSSKHWLPVPSLNYNYEINRFGELRNAKSKHKLYLCKDNCYSVYLDGRRKKVNLKSLMWEVHGKTYAPKKPVTVIALKNKFALRFDTLKKCADYLAPIIHYSVASICKKLNQRSAEFCGWSFFYEEDNLQNVKMTVCKALKGVLHYAVP